MSITDLAQVVPEVQATLIRLQDIVRQRDNIQNDSSLDVMEKTEKVCEKIGQLFNDFYLEFISLLNLIVMRIVLILRTRKNFFFK